MANPFEWADPGGAVVFYGVLAAILLGCALKLSRRAGTTGVGHFLPIQAPATLAALLDEFVTTTEPASADEHRMQALVTAPR